MSILLEVPRVYETTKASLVRRSIPIVVMCIALAGCTRHVRIEMREYSVEATIPLKGQVRPYPGLDIDDRKNGDGPFLKVRLLSSRDLLALSESIDVHHLFYTLSSCEEESPNLLTGAVFDGVEGGVQGTTKTHVYAIFVPLPLQQIRRRAGTQDEVTEQELERARTRGLCVRVGGGNVLGFHISTNAIRLPVSFGVDTLVLSDVNPSNDSLLRLWPEIRRGLRVEFTASALCHVRESVKTVQ